MGDATGFDVILFDFFGTLVTYESDVTQLAYPATHDRLTGWGAGCTHDEFLADWATASAELEARAMSTHLEHSMLDTALAFGARSAPHLSADQCRELATSLLDEWQLGIGEIDGAAAMVRGLATRYRLGIVSNTHDSTMVPDRIAAMGLADVFEVIVLSVDHGYRKPHPSIYAAAVEALGCAPARTAFVGDSYGPDFVGPTAAGLTAFLIDPADQHGVPRRNRLADILDLDRALADPDTY
jgi:putative hydrolase of the HAD superfamily